jgi:hypothetical protein
MLSSLSTNENAFSKKAAHPSKKTILIVSPLSFKMYNHINSITARTDPDPSKKSILLCMFLWDLIARASLKVVKLRSIILIIHALLSADKFEQN